jgi:hypothetical protein
MTNHRLNSLSSTGMYFSQFWKLGSPKPGTSRFGVMARGKGQGSLWVPFIRALIPF